MSLRPTHSGFEPRTRDPERRDFFDLRRRIGTLDPAAWNFKGTIAHPGPPTTGDDPLPNDNGDMWVDSAGNGWVWNGSTWVNVGAMRGPAGPAGPAGPQGVPGPVGPKGDPGVGVPPGGLTGQVLAKQTNADYVTQWVDQTGGSGGGGADEVFIGPDEPAATYELWVDTDEDGGGSGGTGGPVAFVYNQTTPSDTWTIDHNLGFYPNATVIDSAGSVVEGDADYTTINQLVLTFNASFSGVAYLS